MDDIDEYKEYIRYIKEAAEAEELIIHRRMGTSKMELLENKKLKE